MRVRQQSGLLAVVALSLVASAVCAQTQPPKKQAEKWQIDGMIAALNDPVMDVHAVALGVIGQDPDLLWSGFPKSLVVPLLQDQKSSNVRNAAILALGNMQVKDAEVVDQLRKQLNFGTPADRSAAALALSTLQIKDKNVVDELRSQFLDSHEDLGVRSASASALARLQIKDKDVVNQLRSLLQNHNANPYFRDVAARAFGDLQIKDKSVVDPLITIVKDTDEDMYLRIDAASALGDLQVKDKDLVDRLIKQLNSQNPFSGVAQSGIPSLSGTAAACLGFLQIRDKNVVDALRAKLKNRNEKEVLRSAASALGNLQVTDSDVVDQLRTLLNDRNETADVRGAAALALGDLKVKDKDVINQLLELLKNPAYQNMAAETLVKFGPLDNTTLPLLSDSYYHNNEVQATVRFLSHYLLGADPSAELVLKRIMFEQDQSKPQPAPIASLDNARATLRAFHEILPAQPEHTSFADNSEKQILKIARDWQHQWSSSDRELLLSLSKQMSPDNANTLRGLIATPLWMTVAQKLWKVITLQIVFWILLLYFYPRSTQVQAFFFWNRWARKFFGLGYVDLCLTWIPFLRNRLLAPFREDLIGNAQLTKEDQMDYFKDIRVRQGENTYPISEAIPEVLGQSILEGESGLGKSIYLRRLVHKSPRTNAYLPAESCDQGVFELIQLKLKGKASDESFLRSVIWSGGLGIVIDGLNEVTAETREKIRRFVDDFPKANILLATQPMLWKRPPKAKSLRLLPLSDDRMRRFLETRFPTFTPPVAMTEEAYKQRCHEYLDDVLGDTQSEEDRTAARLVLSNPMDLTTAAQILVRGDTPTLKNLQEQQFKRVDADFRDTHVGQPFPLRQFSESVYERLLRDDITLDGTQFFEPIQALTAHKMAITQNEVDADNKPVRRWVFRHDKIRDFFLVHAFESRQDERILQHMDDPRFRGVYLMLASQLPLDQANDLRDVLVDRAADTKDHHLSDAVVEVLRSRRAASSKPISPETAIPSA